MEEPLKKSNPPQGTRQRVSEAPPSSDSSKKRKPVLETINEPEKAKVKSLQFPDIKFFSINEI